MVLGTKEFPQRDAERAAQFTNYGINWMREMMEQNLDQSKAAIESLLKINKQAVIGLDHQAYAVCKRSMQIADETLSNSFDYAHKLMRAKDMQELAQIQADFVSRQAELVGNQTKEVAQDIMQGVNQDIMQEVNKAAKAAAEPLRIKSEAA